MNAGEMKRAELRMRAELVIRDDRRVAGRDTPHLTFDRGPVALELAMHNLSRHIQRATASTWTGHAHPIF